MWQLGNTVLWKDSYLKFDHVPYVVVNHKVYDCRHEVDRHLSEKKNQRPYEATTVFLSDDIIV